MIHSLDKLVSKRVNNINLIRLIAALSVIYGHAGAITGKGEPDIFLRLVGYKFIGGFAVDVFFVVSGFLVSASILSHKGIAYYVTSRILRIYPAIIVCLIFTVLILGPILNNGAPYWTEQTWNYFWVNTTTWNTEYFLPGVFNNLHDHAINGSLWSLPVEVRMYILVVFLYIFGLMEHRSLFNALFFVAILIGFFNKPIYLPFLLHESHLNVIGMFWIGMFYWINRESIPISPWILFMMLLFAASTHNQPNFGYAYYMITPYLIFCLAFMPGLEFFNRLGDYSYGVYLYGWPVQQCLLHLYPDMTTIQNAIWGCIVSTLFGILSWHLVEKPSLKLKYNFLRINEYKHNNLVH
jgi:peptidoglycan/LPS O-acetylase OafA/YrhL